MRRRAAIVVLTFTFSVFGISSAFAHAEVEATSPVKGAVLTSAPRSVWIQFGEKLLVLDKNHINSITVTNSLGKRMENSLTVISGTRATAKIKRTLATGKYTVKYRVVSEDGHVVNGSYFFSVK